VRSRLTISSDGRDFRAPFRERLKARRYSVTLTALRQARVTYRRTQDTGPGYESIHCQEDVDTKTTLVLNRLSYDGSGWRTSGDALLANTAADQAWKRREAARAELVPHQPTFAL
jgi:hypothetical protein